MPDVRTHDLRRTLGSYLAMDGHSSAVVGATLGHTQASTTARYMAIGQNAQRQALAQTSKRLAALGKQHVLLPDLA